MEISLRQWIVLFIIYAVYIIFGAVVFYQIERKYEIEQRAVELQTRSDVHGNLVFLLPLYPKFHSRSTNILLTI